MYITRRAKNYIKKTAQKQNFSLQKNSFDVLYRYSLLAKEQEYRLLFCRMLMYNKDAEVCNANYKHLPIQVSQAYAAKLVLNDSNDIHNAFLMSLGHEMTHKDNDIKVIKGMFIKNGTKFLAHVNEVHADFGAVQKLANNNREKQLKAMKYKQSYKKNVDVSDFCHPSWNQRYNYIEKYNFDEKLIRQIAADVGCTNEKLIEKAIRYFDIIRLN